MCYVLVSNIVCECVLSCGGILNGRFGQIFNPMPKELRFRRRRKLKVYAAPDPSELNWENLDSSRTYPNSLRH